MELNHPIRTFVIATLVLLLALFAIKYFDISYPLSVTSRSASGELSVVGEGKVEVIPDSSSVQAGITVSNATTIDAAQKTINDTNNKIVDALVKLGIPKKDIKTSNYSVTPNYQFEGGRNNINGYNGNATLSIKVKQIDLLPTVIEEVTKNGANQIYGTSYNIENPQKYREEARNKAIQNAREQAQKLASSLGLKLGKITNIAESSPTSPILIRDSAPLGLGKGGGTPDLQPGSETITSTVTLYFEKK